MLKRVRRRILLHATIVAGVPALCNLERPCERDSM